MSANVMIDLETVGTGATAAIATIAAVRFNGARVLPDPFYVRVDVQSAVAAGMKADLDTLLWWLAQHPRAARELYRRPRLSLPIALGRLDDWLGDDGERALFWSNGASFDLPILTSAYRLTGSSAPWRFFNERCYRTLKALNPGVKLMREGTHHNALGDAISQARHAIRLLRKTAR